MIQSRHATRIEQCLLLEGKADIDQPPLTNLDL
jgi:hypothetical protein